MKKISVIVPVCDVEEYLDACVESIINQTIGFNNIELIMVDDGSIDNSYSIMKKYEEKYENVKTYHFDERSGSAGRPRNKGISMAQGKYLMFCDPDDFFATAALLNMYNEIEDKKADFVIGNWSNADIDGTPWNEPKFDIKRFTPFKLSIDDYKDTLYIMDSSMCNKIFNREFIQENKIKCLEGVAGEDTYFSMSAFLKSSNVYYIPVVMYHYRQRHTSVSHAGTAQYFNGMNVAYKALYEVFKKAGQLDFYKFIYIRNMTYLLYRFIDSNKLDYNEKLDILANTRWFYKLSKKINVPVGQKSLEVLINKIIDGQYRNAIDICDIIQDIRNNIPEQVKYNMSKPTKEVLEEIINGLKNKVTN